MQPSDTHPVSLSQQVRLGATFDNSADHFMTWINLALMRGQVTLRHVQVRATDATHLNVNQYLIVTWFRNGHLDQHQRVLTHRSWALDHHSFHGFLAFMAFLLEVLSGYLSLSVRQH